MNDLDLCLEVIISRSRQPLRYIWRWISRRPLAVEAWFQRTTNRKWDMDYRLVTWPMTSHDLERSNSWVVTPIRLERNNSKTARDRSRLRSKGLPIRNDIWGIKWSRDRCVRSATLATAWLLVVFKTLIYQCTCYSFDWVVYDSIKTIAGAICSGPYPGHDPSASREFHGLA